jgi:methionyl-tRNA formyltransferase
MSRPSACYAGVRVEALRALRRYADVKRIVTTPDSWVHRDCVTTGTPVHLVAGRDEALNALDGPPVRLVLSAGLPYILPKAILESGPLFVNAHPGLLPRYRGNDVIKEAYRNAEEHMGVSVHYMTEDVDAGEVIWQERVRVRGMSLAEIYDLLFGVVEPMAISKAMEVVLPAL